jgi:hypothetical protein
MTDKTFTEEEVLQREKELTESLNTNFRLFKIEASCNSINETVTSNIAQNKIDAMELKQTIEEGWKKTQQCEQEIRKDMQDDREHFYTVFVQKKDLRLWVALIMSTIVAAAGFQTYISKTSTGKLQNQVHENLITEIKKIVGKP